MEIVWIFFFGDFTLKEVDCKSRYILAILNMAKLIAIHINIDRPASTQVFMKHR